MSFLIKWGRLITRTWVITTANTVFFPVDSVYIFIIINYTGMVYIGPEDRVQCETCRGILYSFDEGDIPINEHKRHFVLCPYVNEEKYIILEKELANINLKKNNLKFKNINEVSSVNPNEPQREEIRSAAPDDTRKRNKEKFFGDTKETKLHNISHLPAVAIVKELGYSENQIEEALKVILTKVSLKYVNTSVILDELHDMDSD